jgi:hypothetical protein
VLYGTKQAAWCWWKHLQGKLKELGYSPSQFDSLLYILQHQSQQGAIWVHVDNGVVTGSSNEISKQLEQDLKDCLKIKWQKGVKTILGVEVQRNNAGYMLQQKKLIKKLLEDHWDWRTMAKTPLPSNFSALTDTDGKGDPLKYTKYLSLVGILSYLAVGTRPDISFAVNYMARFSASPTHEHWKGLRNIVNYIAGTKTRYLHIKPKETDIPLKCLGEFQRSSYGIFISFYGVQILWIAQRLHTVAVSTCQAEYMALGMATRQLIWVQQLIEDILGHKFVGQLICNN